MLYLKCGDIMKKVLKIIGIILGIIYALIAITLTICLLNYNDYNITVLGNKTLILVRDNELEPNFQKGDLVIVTKNSNQDINIGDKIFFYNDNEKQVTVNINNITIIKPTYSPNDDGWNISDKKILILMSKYTPKYTYC